MKQVCCTDNTSHVEAAHRAIARTLTFSLFCDRMRTIQFFLIGGRSLYDSFEMLLRYKFMLRAVSFSPCGYFRGQAPSDEKDAYMMARLYAGCVQSKCIGDMAYFLMLHFEFF